MMEMTAQKRDWMAAKEIMTEAVKKAGAKCLLSDDCRDVWEAEKDGLQISLEVITDLNAEYLWCDLGVRVFIGESHMCVDMDDVEKDGKTAQAFMGRIENGIKGLDVQRDRNEILDVHSVIHGNGEVVHEYSVVLNLNVTCKGGMTI